MVKVVMIIENQIDFDIFGATLIIIIEVLFEQMHGAYINSELGQSLNKSVFVYCELYSTISIVNRNQTSCVQRAFLVVDKFHEKRSDALCSQLLRQQPNKYMKTH